MTAVYYLPGIRNLTAAVSYHQDARGNTVHLSDSTGALIESYVYDSQGTPIFFNKFGTKSATSGYGVRHLMNGQQWLAELGLYDLRNRFYSPALGRFLQPDPFGGANRYEYCSNNPINRADPFGLYDGPAPMDIPVLIDSGGGSNPFAGAVADGNIGSSDGSEDNSGSGTGIAGIAGGNIGSGGGGGTSPFGGSNSSSFGSGLGSDMGSGGNGGALTLGVNVDRYAGYFVPHSVAAGVWNWITGRPSFSDRQSDIPLLYGVGPIDGPESAFFGSGMKGTGLTNARRFGGSTGVRIGIFDRSAGELIITHPQNIGAGRAMAMTHAKYAKNSAVRAMMGDTWGTFNSNIVVFGANFDGIVIASPTFHGVGNFISLADADAIRLALANKFGSIGYPGGL